MSQGSGSSVDLKPRFMWRILAALCLALLAQFQLETTPISLHRNPWFGLALYVLAILMTFWAWQKGELNLHPLPSAITRVDAMSARWVLATCALAVLLLAFILFKENRFTVINLTVWLTGLFLLVWSFWEPSPAGKPFWRSSQSDDSKFTWRLLLVLLVVALVVFFRAYRLAEVPHEPVSDHAEKLLDVYDVLQGEASIFFTRNTGREAVQIYLTALLALIPGLGISFMTLKAGTVLAGLVTLPFIYLLGTEWGGRRAGLLALVLGGIAYWGNVISRIGLRYTLYPMFAAATLYFLLRGLRRSSRNDIIVAGLLLGAGLHGYTAFRIMPFVVLVAFILYWVHSRSRGMRTQSAFWFGLMALMALMVFLPLLRYTLENPAVVSYRSLTRLTGAEEAIADPVWRILLVNLGRALAMPFWNNGVIWAHSVMGRPALDLVTAALILPGVTLVLARYGRGRDWRDIFLVLSIPLLMLPSILSIAFPRENPSLNRTAAAMIPLVILAGLFLDALISSMERALPGLRGKVAAVGLVAALIAFSCWQNYDLVFTQYDRQYRTFDLNSSEMGMVVREFLDSGGEMFQVFIVESPYWVDSRLVAIAAGEPSFDPIIKRSNLRNTRYLSVPKIYLMPWGDSDTLEILTFLYPQGTLNRYTSDTPRYDFWVYRVEPDSSIP